MAKGQKKQKQESIDKKTFEGLCAIQCTADEVCAVLGICKKTLESYCKNNYNGKTFIEVFEDKKMVGKASLRRRQWNLAEKSVPMAIWLGKQWLGQRDSFEVTNQAEINKVSELLRKIEDGAKNE